MGRLPHYAGTRTVLRELLRGGHRVATEVGVRGGRVDVATFTSDDEIDGIFEVKVAQHLAGIGQLRGYGEAVGTLPRLVLVVEPEHATPKLTALAHSEGVEVWPLRFQLIGDLPEDLPGEVLRVPTIHPETQDHARSKILAWQSARIFNGREWVERTDAA